jgi:hypothetical protein
MAQSLQLQRAAPHSVGFRSSSSPAAGPKLPPFSGPPVPLRRCCVVPAGRKGTRAPHQCLMMSKGDATGLPRMRMHTLKLTKVPSVLHSGGRPPHDASEFSVAHQLQSAAPHSVVGFRSSSSPAAGPKLPPFSATRAPTTLLCATYGCTWPPSFLFVVH